MRFECQPGCIACCEQRGFVYLTEDDVLRAARFLNLTPAAFERKFVYRTANLRDVVVLWARLELRPDDAGSLRRRAGECMRRKAASQPYGAPSAGCVAVQSTMVHLKWRASASIIRTHGRSSGRGIVCASSSTITEPAILWNLRARDVRAANRLSKSWTLVVTTTGAAQSSIASFISSECPTSER